mmetsp:Transcript_9331/g.32748  ORF Transcript_9331/g.32748 Transcript_9331/m.32748 type:complete len:218 (-) Transcript_9331:2-655(-)
MFKLGSVLRDGLVGTHGRPFYQSRCRRRRGRRSKGEKVRHARHRSRRRVIRLHRIRPSARNGPFSKALPPRGGFREALQEMRPSPRSNDRSQRPQHYSAGRPQRRRTPEQDRLCQSFCLGLCGRAFRARLGFRPPSKPTSRARHPPIRQRRLRRLVSRAARYHPRPRLGIFRRRRSSAPRGSGHQHSSGIAAPRRRRGIARAALEGKSELTPLPNGS